MLLLCVATIRIDRMSMQQNPLVSICLSIYPKYAVFEVASGSSGYWIDLLITPQFSTLFLDINHKSCHGHGEKLYKCLETRASYWPAKK